MQSTEIIQITMNFHVNISCDHEIKIIEDCWMCHISQIVYYSLEMDPKRKENKYESQVNVGSVGASLSKRWYQTNERRKTIESFALHIEGVLVNVQQKIVSTVWLLFWDSI